MASTFLHNTFAISRYRQNAFAMRICSGVLHSGSNNWGEQTRMLNALAREVATFNRFNEYRNPMPRGASACVEVVMEYVLRRVELFERPALARRRRPKGVTSGRLADFRPLTRPVSNADPPYFSFLAASLTDLSLTLPVASRIFPRVVLGENCGMGVGRFLFRVSLRFC